MPANERRCAHHLSQDRKASDERRGNFRERGYNSGWDRLSKEIRASNPICQICHESPSECVDHIIPIKRGGTNARANLRAVCLRCNTRKACESEGGFGRVAT